jgi:transcriptional repressor NrdR
LKCPYCGSESTRTLETRSSPENTMRRRKECADCERRFTTYEYVEVVEIMVKKKDGKFERFDLNKIVRGLQKACEKRPIKPEKIYEIAESVRGDIMKTGKKEISSREIGDLVIRYLKQTDRVSYIRFSSVYREFKEPEDFRQALKEVKT